MWKKMLALTVPFVLVAACGGNPEPPPPLPEPVQEAPPPPPAADDGADAAAAEAAAREAAIRRAIEDLTLPVYFGYDQFSLESEAQALLRRKADVLRANEEVRVRIQGHADERGSIEYNLALGMRRATAARDFLTNFGLQASRFEVISFGEERPADTGTTEAAYARNRRAEFELTAGRDAIRPPNSP